MIIIKCDVGEVGAAVAALEGSKVPAMAPLVSPPVRIESPPAPLRVDPAPRPASKMGPHPSDAIVCHFTSKLGEPTACGLATSADGGSAQVMASPSWGHVDCDDCILVGDVRKPVESKPIEVPPKAADAKHAVTSEAGIALCGMTPSVAQIARDHASVSCKECLAHMAVMYRPADSTFAKQAAETDKLLEGQKRFDNLVGLWLQNFGVDSAPQPDRYERMISTFAGFGTGVVWRYVESKGGLASAILDAIVRNSWASQESKPGVPSRIKLAKMVALNMIQVGSATGFPLREYTEACVVHSPGVVNASGAREPDESPIVPPMCKDGREESR